MFHVAILLFDRYRRATETWATNICLGNRAEKMFHPDVFGHFFYNLNPKDGPLFKIRRSEVHTHLHFFCIYTPSDDLTYVHFDTHIFLLPISIRFFIFKHATYVKFSAPDWMTDLTLTYFCGYIFAFISNDKNKFWTYFSQKEKLMFQAGMF